MYFYLFYIDFINVLYYIELTLKQEGAKCEQLKDGSLWQSKFVAARLGVN